MGELKKPLIMTGFLRIKSRGYYYGKLGLYGCISVWFWGAIALSHVLYKKYSFSSEVNYKLAPTLKGVVCCKVEKSPGKTLR